MSKTTFYTKAGSTNINCRKNKNLLDIIMKCLPDISEAMKNKTLPVLIEIDKESFEIVKRSIYKQGSQTYVKEKSPIQITLNGTHSYYKPVLEIKERVVSTPEKVKPEE